MSSTIGNRIRLTLSGESHGKFMTATLDGLASGIEIDRDYIDKILLERRPKSIASSARREADEYEIISGVFNGFTTGAALTILMKNSDVDSSSYEKTKDLARPSQADYPAFIKYKGRRPALDCHRVINHSILSSFNSASLCGCCNYFKRARKERNYF